MVKSLSISDLKIYKNLLLLNVRRESWKDKKDVFNLIKTKILRPRRYEYSKDEEVLVCYSNDEVK